MSAMELPAHLSQMHQDLAVGATELLTRCCFVHRGQGVSVMKLLSRISHMY